jgi:hypothetical protein
MTTHQYVTTVEILEVIDAAPMRFTALGQLDLLKGPVPLEAWVALFDAYDALPYEAQFIVRWALRYGRAVGWQVLGRRCADETRAFLAACHAVGLELPVEPAPTTA